MRTYTHAIEDLEAGRIPEWTNMEAPSIAVEYWCARRASLYPRMWEPVWFSCAAPDASAPGMVF